jgi:hypothetical protein
VKGKAKLDSAVFATIGVGIALAFVANRNHIDFTAVAFASAAAILAFLLPGVALVGRYIDEGLKNSATQVQELSDGANEAATCADKAKAVAEKAPTDKAKAAAAAEAKSEAEAAKRTFTDHKASTAADFGKLLDSVAWLQVGVVSAFLSIPVSAVALVIGPAVNGQTAPDLRAIFGACAITLLMGTGVGTVPITWRILHLKTYRSRAKLSFE